MFALSPEISANLAKNAYALTEEGSIEEAIACSELTKRALTMAFEASHCPVL